MILTGEERELDFVVDGEPEAAPVWTSSDRTIVDVVASSDGMRATIAGGVNGRARVLARARCDGKPVLAPFVVIVGPLASNPNLGEPKPRKAEVVEATVSLVPLEPPGSKPDHPKVKH